MAILHIGWIGIMSGSICQPILAQLSLAWADEHVDGIDSLQQLISEYGWETVQNCLLSILEDDAHTSEWRMVAAALWDAEALISAERFAVDRVIALLYFRFDPNGTDEDNLVWSLTSQLKHVGYLSDYAPLQDPGVVRELARLRLADAGFTHPSE